MNVFEIDTALVNDYEQFARSFTEIRAPDIRSQVENIYSSDRFWPQPLISINPRFERGESIDALVRSGTLHEATAAVFRTDDVPLTLHRHQTQAVAKATTRQSFVVTTGTGSGKSLCFFIPIIDAALRARARGEPARTRAIVIYPMNALANSQRDEIEKFLRQSDLPTNLRPTFARYTGQESAEERERIREAKPDILLTNFMMLELLMTRQNPLDRAVISNAHGLEFLVLDELHTYRGRQGADVAMLVRRVRDRLCPKQAPICIGTSATMATEGDDAARADAVASVATRLFGTTIPPDAVIGESLERATKPALKSTTLGQSLVDAVENDLPETLDDEALTTHPLAVWTELEIGLSDNQRLSRRRPITLAEAAQNLTNQTKCGLDRCRSQLQAFLMLASRPASERGGIGDRAFMAFKLHRFISGPGHVYSTLREPGQRRITLDGQRFDPEDPDARLYQTFFCRNCGQEYHPVVLRSDNGARQILPRDIDETPLDDPNASERPGYLMPEPEGDDDVAFRGELEDYPEDWLETDKGGAPRLRRDRRSAVPEQLTVDAGGMIGSSGRKAWFIPGKFRFCPACKHQPAQQAREINKLAGLSAEGRSSATTLLVSSAVRWMNTHTSLPKKSRKLLGFTDNRQDAALQAGHFNDFLFVSLLRGAILAAVRKAGANGLGDEEFGRRVQAELGFVTVNRGRRQEWMLEPDTKGVTLAAAEQNLSRVLAYRVWGDQRRGWRFTNPNLEELGLVRAEYLGLDDLAKDADAFTSAPDELRLVDPTIRKAVLTELLDHLRQGLAVTADALDPATVEMVTTAAGQTLRDPWSIPAQETPRRAAALIIDAPKKAEVGLKGEPLVVRGGSRSRLARALGHPRFWGHRLKAQTYRDVITALLDAAEDYGLVRRVGTVFDVDGWRLAANAVRLVPAKGRADGKRTNPYFTRLYSAIADTLADGGDTLFGIEGREHTAQVDAQRREWREWRFRWGDEDRAKLGDDAEDLRKAGEPNVFLPVLFCSPTMELGIDISALNAVYLRNMPPTSANYAQRSGRAGRSGQAALVVTYCAAQSPHDQYYFSRRDAMVSGIVRPPAIDLANRDLIEAHMHALWLAESAQELLPDIPHVLDLHDPELPVQKDLARAFSDGRLGSRAVVAMQRLLDAVKNDLNPETAPWAADRAAFARATADNAPERLSKAFDRWRQLYQSARTQLTEANRRSEMHGLSAAERKDAKIQQAQANEQIALLERGTSNGSSDFYTYRYLATEGFLPGYNFPRLPLYAYVPATGTGAKAAYLQRARFIAISEFGPRSLIYHEGRAYRVHKAKLPPTARSAENGQLTTATVYVCDGCGAAHQSGEPERCHACNAKMSGVHPVRNVLRIDNVETTPVERITANDEDRQRQGFEIQTVFTWSLRDGDLDVSIANASDSEGDILLLSYAPGATISRLNKGLRRRKEKSLFGFGIDPASGRWTGNPVEGDDDGDPDEPVRQRVVPIVQDNKNALLLRLAAEPLAEDAMATLQHALSRGLEIVFQLEEGEIQTEPVPSRENRRGILAFEATEGGAGVLGRLTSDAKALASVARTALDMMHYRNIDAAIASGDPADLSPDPDASCVKGCYRCLLSYYNQPDHEQIDRTNPEATKVLLRLARGSVELKTASATLDEPDPCRAAIARWGLPPPDPEPLAVDGTALALAWRRFRVVAAVGSIDPGVRADVEAQGYDVVVVPDVAGENAPVELVALLGATT